MHRPGIEPGPPAWQASILPLNQRCWLSVSYENQQALLQCITYLAVVAEWLRRLTRNEFPSGSVGSNPTNCDAKLGFCFQKDLLQVRLELTTPAFLYVLSISTVR